MSYFFFQLLSRITAFRLPEMCFINKLDLTRLSSMSSYNCTHNSNNNSECILFSVFSVFSWQVFKELLEFDVSDAFGVPKDDGHFWWPGLSSRRRRRSSVFPWHWDITKDARFAFTVRTHTRSWPSCRREKTKTYKLASLHLDLCLAAAFLSV